MNVKDENQESPGAGRAGGGERAAAPAAGRSGGEAAGARTKHAERSEATRAALIGAARPLFAQRGFAGVGTEEIVRAAGVTRGALYHQFRDKQELFAAVFEQLEQELAQRTGAAAGASGSGDPLVELRIGAETWLDACTEPEVQRIVLLDAPAVLGWDRWREIGMRYSLGLMEAVLQHAVEAGQIAPQPVRPLAHVLLGAIDEAAHYVATADNAKTARAEVGAVLDRLLAALGAT
jgi:AcrR family transcriptional regulator